MSSLALFLVGLSGAAAAGLFVYFLMWLRDEGGRDV